MEDDLGAAPRDELDDLGASGCRAGGRSGSGRPPLGHRPGWPASRSTGRRPRRPVALGQQAVDQGGADEAGAAGDEGAHRAQLPSGTRSPSTTVPEATTLRRRARRAACIDASLPDRGAGPTIEPATVARAATRAAGQHDDRVDHARLDDGALTDHRAAPPTLRSTRAPGRAGPVTTAPSADDLADRPHALDPPGIEGAPGAGIGAAPARSDRSRWAWR